MPNDLPDPLVPPECDCTDLDGFMLNVERLMASELVALSTHEEVAAALFLWCRAWKQTPSASLPDDERVLAAYARLPLGRFRRIKNAVLHGFVKCSDGRLYHRVLAIEASSAYRRKMAFRERRETDAKRLREWRKKHDEARSETLCETRFEREGQGQGQGRDRDQEERKKDPVPNGTAPDDPVKDLFDRGVAILGHKGRSLVGRARKDYGDLTVLEAIAACEDERPTEPAEFFVKALRKRSQSGAARPNEGVF